MRAKMEILFLGMTLGGATFVMAGFACWLIIAQVQYSTLQTRIAQAIPETNHVSTRDKNTSVLADASEAHLRHELVSNAP